jgi:hypothetical protein
MSLGNITRPDRGRGFYEIMDEIAEYGAFSIIQFRHFLSHFVGIPTKTYALGPDLSRNPKGMRVIPAKELRPPHPAPS